MCFQPFQFETEQKIRVLEPWEETKHIQASTADLHAFFYKQPTILIEPQRFQGNLLLSCCLCQKNLDITTSRRMKILSQKS